MESRLSEKKSPEELYRLNSTELNALIYQRALEFNPQSFSMDGVHVCHLIKRHDRKFIIFPMSKDAEDTNNESHIPFFYDLIKKFKEKHKKQDYIIFMPVLKCRGAFRLPTQIPGVKRLHAVLWICDLETMHIKEHDAQPWFREYLLWYPNKRKDLNLPVKVDEDKAHGRQKDDYSCGYYTAEYIIRFLREGNADSFPDVMLSIAKENSDKSEYLKKYNISIDNSVYLQPTTYPDSAEDASFGEEVVNESKSLLKEWVKIEDEANCLASWEFEGGEILLQEEEKPVNKRRSVLLTSGLFKNVNMHASASFADLTDKTALSFSEGNRRLSLSN